MKLAHSGSGTSGNGGILDEPEFQYNLCPWGDLIYGTPEQLQRIGIGADIAFPRESDRRRRRKCVDPRGLKTEICHFSRGIFSASISFPGREYDGEVASHPYAPGVTIKRKGYGDEYVGTAEALVTAGIVPPGHFPGYPGMRKVTVTILPDGSLPTSLSMRRAPPGTKQIERASKGQKATYRVCVSLTADEYDRRAEAYKTSRDDWERRMFALPRPAPLVDLPNPLGRTIKVRPVPNFRTDGNVIYLGARSAG